ncbi:SGNH/GDSL hydrolase family protein [Nocardioides immobilis]|uniref:SGNH/GDSL hydrolase family protein n=1 Tax=Nocardioides immobilis TaxID=2049295 RepID=A0A417Y507_9ACTN|nr:SGNH/GDSL hydrolase family protein [Nocardioides immobilis]RHW27768.1 SGNH/GDSL hydrolase family protein [Nocardioides immobilis]
MTSHSGSSGSRYLRYAALGDSTTVGIGDPVPGADGRQLNRLRGEWRGWARLLAESLATSYDVSFCNVAISGATAAIVREQQLADALAHRPDLASLIVGVNDTMRSTWDAGRVRDDLLTVASRLDAVGATLMTVRFHDHGAMIGLPRMISRPMSARIDHVNAVYDEIHDRWGGVRLDLAGRAELHRRDCWSIDRFHPSEVGHRALARAFAERLDSHGYDVVLPSLESAGGLPPSWKRDLGWMVAEGAPWMGRRAKDLGPWVGRRAWEEMQQLLPRRATNLVG